MRAIDLLGALGTMKKKKRQLEFSSHTGNLALMRNYVRRFLEAFPFSERQRTLMVLGVDEACTNIIRHAYHLRDDQLISLSLEGKSDCVCVRLRDYGILGNGNLMLLEKNNHEVFEVLRDWFDRKV